MSKPPYVPSTLHPPLTAAQRTNITNWLFTSTVSGWTPTDKAIVLADSDAMLIDLYSSWYTAETGPTPGPGNPVIPPGLPGSNTPLNGILQTGSDVVGGISSVADFLNYITSAAFWVRAGEVVVGVVLLKVGVTAVFSGNAAGAAKQTGSQLKSGSDSMFAPIKKG